jgi:hypothetical protein
MKPAWLIELPTVPKSGPAQPVPEVRNLSAMHRDKLIERGVYTREEMDAQVTGAEISWAAEPSRMFGPLTTAARAEDKVIGGLEVWHQQRDRFWFLEGLIRDQAPEFKGVGADMYRATLQWWIDTFAGFGDPLKVHSMVREEGAVGWWTTQIGRPPDFTDAFIKNDPYYFEAVGWILYPR